MNRKNDPKRNASGCMDLTAYEAIKKVDRDKDRHDKLIKTLLTICELSGFRVIGRITVEDKRTGFIWR